MKHLLSTLLLVVVFGQGAWAQDHYYFPYNSTRVASLFVTEDPLDVNSPKKPDFTFWVHFDEGLYLFDHLAEGSPAITIKQSLVTGPVSDPYKRVALRAVNGPVANQRIGMYRTETDAMNETNLDITILYTFYEHNVVFFNSKGDTLKSTDVLEGKVNESMDIRAQLVVPIGPDKGKLDTNAAWTFDLTPSAGSAGLRFLKPTATTLTDTLVFNKLQFVKGEASFKLTSTAAFQTGGFSYSGKPNDFGGSYRTTGQFPASLRLLNPDFPSLDSAAIYDTDGDGLGDSIAGWFGADLNKVTDALGVLSNWPNNGDLAGLSRTVVNNDIRSTVSISGIKPVAQTIDTATGSLKVNMVSVANGQSGTTQSPLINKIGPVIQKVTVLKGVNGAPDTLVAAFNKPLDPDSVARLGDLLIHNGGSPLTVQSAQNAGGSTWIFTVPNGVVQAGDSLSVNVNGNGVSFDGNRPGYNKPAIVTLASKVPPVTENGNGFFDSDADGRMDSVVVQFLEPLSVAQLGAIDFRFVWKDSSGTSFELRPPTDQLQLGADGVTVSWAFNADSFNIMPFLTSIEARDYGYAALISSFVVNGQEFGDTLMVPMADRMAPVLVSAFIIPESTDQQTGDKLKLEFSEAVDPNTLKNLDFLQFNVNGQMQTFELDNYKWSDDGRTLELRLAENAPLASRPNPADSLRISGVDFGITDLQGNTVGPHAPLIMLEGDPRVLIETATMVSLDRDFIGLGPDGKKMAEVSESFHDDGTPIATISNGSLGVLLDIGQATIPDDSTGELDLTQIGMDWELFVYTNQGAYVAGANNSIRCNDSGFASNGASEGNCFENRKKIYLRWNLLSQDGRKAGVGVYLAKIRIKVHGQKQSRTVEKVFYWGVRSGSAGRTYR